MRIPLPNFLADPGINSRLLHDEGEYVIDEVHHHWAVYWRGVVDLAIAVLFFVLYLVTDVRFGWPLFFIAVGFVAHAGWMALVDYMDRFVITNMRVFRLTGVFSRTMATMPMSRILDITVEQPPLGRLLGFGHFRFETAAQAQGLRDIRYVSRPGERDLIIQRIVQRAGLRNRVT
jgi:membrane protein YdbS with pleckstrin-like domain